MKKTKLFHLGKMVGCVSNGIPYIKGKQVTLNSDFFTMEKDVESVCVYEKIGLDIANPDGELMELIECNNTLAIVKDEYDITHIAILCSGFWADDGTLRIIEPCFINENETVPVQEVYPPVWILINESFAF